MANVNRDTVKPNIPFRRPTGKIIWPAPVLVMVTNRRVIDGVPFADCVRASIGVMPEEILDWRRLQAHGEWLAFNAQISGMWIEYQGKTFQYNSQPFGRIKPPAKRAKAPKACPHCGGEL